MYKASKSLPPPNYLDACVHELFIVDVQYLKGGSESDEIFV